MDIGVDVDKRTRMDGRTEVSSVDKRRLGRDASAVTDWMYREHQDELAKQLEEETRQKLLEQNSIVPAVRSPCCDIFSDFIPRPRRMRFRSPTSLQISWPTVSAES